MRVPKLKTLKPSFENLSIIGRVAYEATGDRIFESMYLQMWVVSNNFFSEFYRLRNRAIKSIEQEDFFKYNYTVNGKEIPFLYNSL